jgi:hypothetical protein
MTLFLTVIGALYLSGILLTWFGNQFPCLKPESYWRPWQMPLWPYYALKSAVGGTQTEKEGGPEER